MVAGVAVGLVVVALLSYLVTSWLTSPDDEEVAEEPRVVQLVPAADPGPDPFTVSVVPASVDVGELSAKVTGFADSASVSEEEIQYGTTDEPTCDKGKLADALDADPEVREAWLDLMGSDDVDGALDPLTALVLARDTAVTNSSYRAGEARQFSAVLQAGTPVLVDPDGLPRVRCSCGNPLVAPPEDIDLTDTVGEPWSGFEASTVVQVGTLEPSDGPVAISVVDVDGGEKVTVDLGTQAPEGPATVSLDGYIVSDDDGVRVVDEDGVSTVVLDHPVAEVRDDGAGGLVFQQLRTGMDPACEYCDRRDVRSTEPADGDEATIWHLPAGERDPVALPAPDDPTSNWFALGDAGLLDGRPTVVYAEVRVDDDAPEDEQEQAALRLHHLDDGSEIEVHDFETTWENYVGPYAIGDGIVLNDISYAEDDYLAYGPDGASVESGCEAQDVSADVPSWCGSSADPVDGGLVVGFGVDDDGSIATIDRRDRATGEVLDSIDLEDRSLVRAEIDVSGDRAVVTMAPADFDAVDRYPSLVVDFEAGTVEELPFDGNVRLLAVPLVRPVDDETSETTAPPSGPAPTWDEIAGATLSSMCDLPTLTLTDGHWSDDELEASFDVQRDWMATVESADGPLTVVLGLCTKSSRPRFDTVLFFEAGGALHSATNLLGPTALVGDGGYGWEASWDAAFPDDASGDGPRLSLYESITDLEVQGDVVVVRAALVEPGEPACCATLFAEVTIRPDRDGVELVDIQPE